MYRLYRTLGKIEKHSREGERTSILDLYRPLSARRYLALISLLLLMVIGGTVFAGEPLIRWIHDYYMEQHQDHVAIQKNGDEEDPVDVTEFRKYRFQTVPEGYYIETEKVNEKFQKYLIYYKNSKGDILRLKQTVAGEEILGDITSDATSIEEIKIDKYTGYYAEDNGVGTVIFSDGIYMITIYGTLPKEMLINLAKELELEP